MPPSVLRYETPPTTRLAPQTRLIRQRPRRRADENPSGAPRARSQYRVTTPPPPNNQQSVRQNTEQAAALPSPHPAHAPTAEAAAPGAPQFPAVHLPPEPRSHPPAYEPHRRGADPIADAQHSRDQHSLQESGGYLRASLRFALRPPPHQPAHENHAHISMASAVVALRQPRAVLAPRRRTPSCRRQQTGHAHKRLRPAL